jgi:CoA:oxalate CoA-transferase
MTATRPVLDGITVIDLTRALSGPYATLILAGLGARVIKIEEPGNGDTTRTNIPYLGRDGVSRGPRYEDDMSVPFLDRCRGKFSITLNLKHPGAVALYDELVGSADIVVENFSPGTADRLGVGYEHTRAVNPRIVYTSISGFGQDSAEGDARAYDLITQALSGLTMVSGAEGADPVRVGLPMGDLTAPFFAVIGTLAALVHARQSGVGQHVDVSMLGALTSLVAVEPWDAYRAAGMSGRTGNFLDRLAPFGLFPTRDGQVAICAATDKFFQRLPAAIGQEELQHDPRFEKRSDRARHADDIHQILSKWTGERTTAQVIEQLGEHAVPVAPVRTPAQAIHDERVLARHETVPLAHPVYGTTAGIVGSGLPIRFSSAPNRIEAAAPLLGQHNDAVYGEQLGRSPEWVKQMTADGLL